MCAVGNPGMDMVREKYFQNSEVFGYNVLSPSKDYVKTPAYWVDVDYLEPMLRG